MTDRLKKAFYNIQNMFSGTKNDPGLTFISFRSMLERIESESPSKERDEILNTIYYFDALIDIAQRNLPECIADDYE